MALRIIVKPKEMQITMAEMIVSLTTFKPLAIHLYYIHNFILANLNMVERQKANPLKGQPTN